MTAEEWEKKWGSLPQESQEPFNEKDAEIERLKALLTRAADALENQFEHMEAREYRDCVALIAELRKAGDK